MKQILLLAFLVTTIATAQNKKAQDQKAIKEMCGCYEVTFNFAETFEYVSDSNYVASEVKHDKGLEWVELIKDTDNEISMQHLLIVGKPDNPHIIKHWRQDWEFENTSLYIYNRDNIWQYVNLPKEKVKGQWTQKVFQVDDSPRYEGSASWVHIDGKSYWENETTAPLPRREYTTRSDYNVTIRRNRHEITKYGWLHEQDNDKVMRKDATEDVILAQEKGYNTYVKIADNKCQAGQDYWLNNKDKWAVVRAKWDEVFARNTDLILEEKVDNKVMFKYLLDDKNYKTAEKINPVIDSFIKS